jgi:hypothetical protein
MRALVSPSEGGVSRFELDPGRALGGRFIRWLARASHAKAVAKLEGADPSEMLLSNPKNFKLSPHDVVESSLSPPGFFSSTGDFLALWKIVLEYRKAMNYQIEDVESLRTALDRLPNLLGTRLNVTVAWDENQRHVVRTG